MEIRLQFSGDIVPINQKLKRSKNNMYISKRYKKYFADIVLAFQTQTQYRGEKNQNYDLEITVSLWKMQDTDSCLKSIMDAIEKSGVVYNDRQIRNIRITRYYHPKYQLDKCVVKLIEIEKHRVNKQEQIKTLEELQEKNQPSGENNNFCIYIGNKKYDHRTADYSIIYSNEQIYNSKNRHNPVTKIRDMEVTITIYSDDDVDVEKIKIIRDNWKYNIFAERKYSFAGYVVIHGRVVNNECIYTEE